MARKRTPADTDRELKELIDRFFDLPATARRSFMTDNPIMGSDRVASVIFQIVQGIFEEEPAKRSFLEFFSEVGGRLFEQDGKVAITFNPDRHAIGRGPIEKLWSQVEAKLISLPEAVSRVKTHPYWSNLSYLYIKALCDDCWRQQKDNPTLAVRRQLLVTEVAESVGKKSTLLTDDEIWRIRRAAGHQWIECCGVYLVRFADRHLFRSASSLGERLIRECRRRNDNDYLSRLLERMGILYLDPYTVDRDTSHPQNYFFSLKRWAETASSAEPIVAPSTSDANNELPSVEKALDLAEKYLRQAAASREKSRSLVPIVALLQVLFSKRELGRDVRDDEMLGLIEVALPLARDNKDEERRVRLENWRSVLVRATPPAKKGRKKAAKPKELTEFTELLSTSPDDLEGRLGFRSAVDLVSQAVNFAASNKHYGYGLSLIDHYRVFIDDRRLGDPKRSAFWFGEVKLLADWLNEPAGSRQRLPYFRPVVVGAMKMFDREMSEAVRNVAQEKQIASLLTKAFSSPVDNQEEEGIQAIAEAVERDPFLLDAHSAALTNLNGALFIGAGTNRFNREEYGEAATLYFRALLSYLIIRQAADVSDCLGRFADVIEIGHRAVAKFAVGLVGDVAVDVEGLLGAAGRATLQDIYRKASARWVNSDDALVEDIDSVFRIFRLAKGHRFARALRLKEQYDYRHDKEALAVLQTVIETESQQQGSSGEDDSAQDELILISQQGSHEFAPGSTPRQRLANAQRSFDDHITQKMARWHGRDLGKVSLDDLSEPSCTVDEIRGFLAGKSTVIIDLFMGQDRMARPTLYALFITADQVHFRHKALEETTGWDSLEDDGFSFVLDPLAPLVLSARIEAQAVPSFNGQISQEGAKAFAAATQLIVGVGEDLLRSFREAGHDHLCVVPHGSLHFFPMHIAGERGVPLATDWIVTYAPAIEVLLRPEGARKSRPGNMTSVGLDFKGIEPPTLNPLEAAPTAAREVSELFGGRLLTNKEATVAAVLDAAQKSSYVHLFTHGSQCTHAASFNAVYLAGSADVDGVLEAYEISALDFASLDILTLSACESALGRFDNGDNLVGLPGSFFLAGARTIIGTLWPIASDVARFFSLVSTKRSKKGRQRRKPLWRHSALGGLDIQSIATGAHSSLWDNGESSAEPMDCRRLPPFSL